MTWLQAPVRRLFRVINGGTPTPDEANWGGGVAWATPIDLARVDGRLITTTQRTLSERGLRTGSRAVKAASLILSTRAPVGYVAQTAVPMAFNQGCRGLEPLMQLDVRFFGYQLSTMTQRLNTAAQGSTFVELSSEAVASLLVFVPSLSEQRAIADFLDDETLRMDALIGKRQLALVQFDARRQATYFAGVSGLLTAPDQPRVATTLPWLPAMPESWSTALLKLLATLGSGHTPSRSHPEWWVAGDCVIPWITTGEVAQIRSDRVEEISETRERISAAGLASSAAELRPGGTVVLSRTASVGFSAIMGTAMATSQDFATWTCGSLLRPDFVLLCLRAMRGDLLGRLAIGSTHKTIYMPDIESIRVPVPPITEQDRIVNAVREQLVAIDRFSDTVWRQIRLLRERREALITAAVTGEIDVRRGAA